MGTPHRGRRRLLLAVATAGLLPAVPACERSTPPSAPPPTAAHDGWLEFEGTWNAAGTRRSLTMSGRGSSSALHLRGTVLLSGEGRPGVGFRAEIVAFADSAGELRGRCVWTDERGDQVFSELTRSAGGGDGRIAGAFIGGTGRFVGATGGYEFTWQYLIDTDGDAVQGRTSGLKGRYRLAGAGASEAAR